MQREGGASMLEFSTLLLHASSLLTEVSIRNPFPTMFINK